MKHQVDVKVYVTMNAYEVPIGLPDEMLLEGKLRIGARSICIDCSEEQMEKLEAWAAGQADFKILGITTLN